MLPAPPGSGGEIDPWLRCSLPRGRAIDVKTLPQYSFQPLLRRGVEPDAVTAGRVHDIEAHQMFTTLAAREATRERPKYRRDKPALGKAFNGGSLLVDDKLLLVNDALQLLLAFEAPRQGGLCFES